jgi:hypothetical protein
MRASLSLAGGLAALLLATAPAGAADRTRVGTMLEAMRMAESMGALKAQQIDVVRDQMLADCLKRGSTQARCEEAVPQLMAPVQRAFDNALEWDALREEMVSIYAEALTDAEVDAAIAHYSTPEGQSLLGKLPMLVQRGAALGEKRMATIGPTLRKELGEVAGKLAAEDAARAAKAAGPAMAEDPLQPLPPGLESTVEDPLQPLPQGADPVAPAVEEPASEPEAPAAEAHDHEH